MAANPKTPVEKARTKAVRQEKKALDAAAKVRTTLYEAAHLAPEAKAWLSGAAPEKGNEASAQRTLDSFQNWMLQLGVDVDNQMSASTYGFNPITRVRTLLEWIHRGSWIGGVAIDLVADDMVKNGIEFTGSLDPGDIEILQSCLVDRGVWSGFKDTVKWARLYGGALGVMLIDGHDLSTPLNLDSIGPGQFKGLYAVDRWMVEPVLANLVQDYGPDFGNPMFYRVTADSPVLSLKTIHYSRCIRMEGIRLPYWQRVMENLWGISELERIYDRMIAFDAATQGASQLVHKMFIRIFKVKGLREIASSNQMALAGLMAYLQIMRRAQSNEGITLIDADDDYVPHQQTVNTGISNALINFGEQLCGALQIPATRLFGMSPSGLNSTGESDLRTYYDGIKLKQENYRVPLTTVIEAVARSEDIELPDDWNFKFVPLWQMTDEQKAGIAKTDSETISSTEERGLISPQVAMKELKQSSKITGRFTNISDRDIEEAEDEIQPPEAEEAMGGPGGDGEGGEMAPGRAGAPKPKAADQAGGQAPIVFPHPSSRAAAALRRRVLLQRDLLPISEFHGIPIVIECTKGNRRWPGGPPWPANYGYIRRTRSAEGSDEAVDCFVGPDTQSDTAFIFNHFREDGGFEEHKVMLGYRNLEAARGDYVKAYHLEPQGGHREMACREVISYLSAIDPAKPIPGGHKDAAARLGA